MKKDRIIAVLAAACVFSLVLMMLALKRNDSAALFVPPPFDPEAVTGIPDVPDGLGYQELDAQVYRVNLCGEIYIQNGAAELWFTNPMGNAVWMKVRILDQEGMILGESGLLRPGEYVRWVKTSETAPGTPVTLKVMAYEPETYHSAGALTFHTQIAAE